MTDLTLVFVYSNLQICNSSSHCSFCVVVVKSEAFAFLFRKDFHFHFQLSSCFLALARATEVLLSPFVDQSKHKSLKRVIGDTAFRYLTDNLSVAELQYHMGTSVGVYTNWARKAKAPIAIDEMEDGGKLLWIGPKRTEKVSLYCHGGGYIVSVQEFTIPFWKYIQLEYIELIDAPSEWYRGWSGVVERVFVSTGGAECLRDHDRMFLEDRIKPWHARA
ncbi:hypothetical protein BT96DRAFT_991753 [Gymnopus androsaceus JB14]|uniref:Alpha/beta-hydrolase n=1 Tax=Gymnopus androsaceus JB14 TaxID=1447944 RepID=A0A6A4HYU0_9AGAR|nr:hypothetical protein BT96DRAFT_991753 [Gymnopus androsaceus JB14]